MARTSTSPARPDGGGTALAALACGLLAFALAIVDAFSPVLSALPFSPALIVFGFAGMGFGLRELSVRAQFSAQADRYAASRKELEAKNRWFNITEAHARVGHWRLNLSTNAVFWSNATYAIHGLKPGTPPSLEDALSFYHEDDRELVARNIERSRKTGQPYTFRARIIGADGQLRYVDAGASSECDASGTPIAMFGVIKDRTGEEEMQEDLRSARDAAKALANSKGQFLARMSHEIRTPMNGLLGFAELLERSDLSAEQRRHTDLIIDSGKSLQTLLNDILDLSKIEAGKTEINVKNVEIRHLVNRVKQMTEASAREKSINLICDTAPNVPHNVDVDGLRLRQILSNLLANAVRFTERGTVSLTVRLRDSGPDGSRSLLFAVSDTGAGISPALQDRIFDPFTQEHTDQTDLASGTGLGLAISRQLAELMGGTLTLRSELGQGSVFTLSVPLASASETEDPVIGGSPPILGQPATAITVINPVRILLAEDYDINRELITDMTRQMGVEVECAEDGQEAIEMVHAARAEGQPYGLILMDLQMPILGGLEATERLRAAGISEQELPIVALTANAFADDIENCLAAGMQAHLAKPVSMQRLANALNKWATAEGLAPSSDGREISGQQASG